MKDIQAMKTGFPVMPISKVGIKNIELPIWITVHGGNWISTIANISSYCDLVEDVRGINMSRIPRTIFSTCKAENKKLITNLSEEVVRELQKAHDTNDVYFKARFKYPYAEKSPVTNLESPEVVNVTVETTLKGDILREYITIEMVGMSLCPCSKEMSMLKNNLTEEEIAYFATSDMPESLREKINEAGFGAHNQKSNISLKVEIDREGFCNIEDLIDLVNISVSAKTFSVLKRPDEKYVTEMSYMNGYINEDKVLLKNLDPQYGPKFVEDIARQLSKNINETMLDASIKDYVICVVNKESIHSNNIEAVAVLSAGRELS